MNYLDIIILILILLAAVNGLRRGFIEEIAGLAALILGIWAAIKFSGFAGGIIAEHIEVDEKYLSIIAFIVTFLLVLVLVIVVGKVVEKMINIVSLGFLNRLAGLVFGAAKGAVFLSVFLLIFNYFNKDLHFVSEETIEKSQLWEPVKNLVPSIFPFLDFFDDDKDFDERMDGILKTVS